MGARMLRQAFVATLLAMLSATEALATSAGVVTAVSGQVTVARSTTPSLPLKFKDEVFLKDRISTAERSLARLLLDQKALVTVRELSELEITEEAGRSTVDLGAGKIAIGVARQRMRAGEIVEIRTQNAVAAIRGTVVVAENLPVPPGAPPQSRIHVLSGYVDITPRNNPGAPPMRMVAPASIAINGQSVGVPVTLTDIARRQLLSDLHQTLPQHLDAMKTLASGEFTRATALARIITGSNRSAGEKGLDVRDTPADASTAPGKAPITPPTRDASVRTLTDVPPLFAYTNQTTSIAGDLYRVSPITTQNLSTDLLRAVSSALSIGGDVLDVEGSLASTTARPFVGLEDSLVSAQTLARLQGGTLTLTGALLDAVNSAFTVRGSALLDALSGTSLVSPGALPLMSFTNGSLLLDPGAKGFLVGNRSRLDLQGGLLEAIGATIASSDDFVLASGRGRIVETASSAPLLSITGGTHRIATAGSIVHLAGTASALDAASGLVVGMEQPLAPGGVLLDLAGASVTAGRAVTVDVALLEATAPLLRLRPGANGQGASLTTSASTLDLTSRAKLDTTATLVSLDQSRLTINNAALAAVAGGSYLRTAGDFVTLANGSTLTINNGVLLFASGGAIVNIRGALIAFGGTPGNMVSVSNQLAFVNIGGLPVALTGGALAGNVLISGAAIKNAGLGSITPNKALIRVDGAATHVTISGN